MRYTRYVIRSTRYVIMSTRYVIRSTRYVMMSTRYAIRSTRYLLTPATFTWDKFDYSQYIQHTIVYIDAKQRLEPSSAASLWKNIKDHSQLHILSVNRLFRVTEDNSGEGILNSNLSQGFYWHGASVDMGLLAVHNTYRIVAGSSPHSNAHDLTLKNVQ